MAEPVPKPRRSRLRLLAAATAGLLPLIPVAIGLSLGGGTTRATASGTTRATATTKASHLSVVGSVPKPSRPSLALPPGSGSLVALIAHRTALRARPRGHIVAELPPRTPFGSPQAVWVRRVSGRWLGVVSVLAGNNRLGWIAAANASLSRVDWELRVSLSHRKLTVLDHGRPVQHYDIAVGAPASPTPTGRFAVTDRLTTGDPAGPYGCCILALSAVAPHAIQGWTGGNRIAIHSTPETSTIGESVSHGCLRLTLAEARWLLQHIPLGTPAFISS